MDHLTVIRPAYDACQGTAYVACTDPRVIAVEVNGQKVNSNYIYVDASRYEVSKNPYLDLAVTFYFRGGSISTTVSINLFSYMAHDIVPYPFPPVVLPNIEDVLYYDASTDIRPAYDACQGTAYVACTDPRVIAVEVNGQKVNSNYIYVDASRYEVSKNPYLDLAVTFYFRGGSISTTVSINLFSYMAHDIVPID